MAELDCSPRTFASPGEAVGDLLGVARRAKSLAAVYARGELDPALRERVMVAVSHVNSCRGCTYVHERWASRTGVSAEDLEAIGLGELGELDPRDRAAVAYAAALAEARFRRPVDPALRAAAEAHLTPRELDAVEAVARAMALANLTTSTTEELSERLRSAASRSRRPRSRAGTP
jgi:AhpD family alkylhydroperoxidase